MNQSAIVSQRRRERGRESWYRDDEEQLQRNHDRSTLLDYSGNKADDKSLHRLYE